MSLANKVINSIFPRFSEIITYNHDIRKNIIVSGSPRGGTTWLAEILFGLKGYPLVWEPLLKKDLPEQLKKELSGWKYITLNSGNEEIKNYLDSVFSGKFLNRSVSHLHYFKSFLQLFIFKGLLIKFTQANPMIPWLNRTYPIPIVYITRHPCSVISSQLNHPAWRHVNKESVSISQNLNGDFPHLKEIHKKINSFEEVLAFRWAVENLIPLYFQESLDENKIYFTSYERIVVDRDKELKKMLRFLDHRISRNISRRLNVQSKTVRSKIDTNSISKLLYTYKQRFSPTQISNIMDIVNDVGVSIYNDDIVPEFS